MMRTKKETPPLDTPQAKRVKDTLPALTSTDYLHAATSDNTRKAYRQDISHFYNWGGQLPCTPTEVTRYLAHYAQTLRSSTLKRRLCALKAWHKTQRFDDPTADPMVAKIMKGIAYKHGIPPSKATALTKKQVETLLVKAPKSNSDLRNNALFMIGFYGAFRRSELVAIHTDDIDWCDEGIQITVPRSKTDQTGSGEICTIPKMHSGPCPVRPLKEWIAALPEGPGPVFCRMLKNGRPSKRGITASQVNVILKKRASVCGFDNIDSISSHSLRRGFATEAAKHGALTSSIMKQGRWKTEKTVIGYIEAGRSFKDNAAMCFDKKG